MSSQIRDLRKGVALVIGTPGRILDHVRRGTLCMDSVHTVVLDEGDHMLDMGFREELEGILDAASGRKGHGFSRPRCLPLSGPFPANTFRTPG